MCLSYVFVLFGCRVRKFRVGLLEGERYVYVIFIVLFIVSRVFGVELRG